MANKKVSQLTSKPSVLTTDLFPIADPSTGQLFKTTISDLGTAIGSGVSSVNTLVGAVVLDTDDIQELASPTNKWFTDTRARAALSASSPLTYNSGTGAFGIQVATGSQNGYLSSTDWTTFNAKQAALSGTGFVKISGTTISYDNSTYLTTSDAASTYLPLSGGTLTNNLFLANNNTVGGTNYYIGQQMATNDYWRIYGNSVANDQGEMIFELGDNALGFDTLGQRFRFFYSAASSGISKSPLIIDYNDSIFLTTLTANSFIKSGGTSAQFLKADGSIDSATYLPLAGGTLTGTLNGTTANFTGNLTFNNVSSSTLNIRASATNGTFQLTSGGSNGYTGGGSIEMVSNDRSGTNTRGEIYISAGNASANTANGFIALMTSNTDRVRITYGGALLVGLTSATGAVAGDIWTSANIYVGTASSGSTGQGGVAIFQTNIDAGHANGTASGATYMRYIYNGSVIGSISQSGTTAVLYNITSDYRLKQDLKSINGLELVNKIKVYNYEWKSDKTRMDGVLAHELAEVLPYAVTGVKDGEQMQQVDYSKIVPVMVQAIKELKAKIDILENK